MMQHFSKYFQKYCLFVVFAIIFFAINACSTRKVPNGSYLLISNKFEYKDGKVFSSKIPDFVSQKPNKKTLFLAPVSLWIHNLANPKTDTILLEYMTYPANIRNRNLQDSISLKYNHPEFVGRKMFWSRFLHSLGQEPVILSEPTTSISAERIKKYLIRKGYWDAKVSVINKLKPTKKAYSTYVIEHGLPTIIKSYNYNITDPNIKNIYEQELDKSFIKVGKILDQENLEKEIDRIENIMKNNGYYDFNISKDEIVFVADTLNEKKNIPLTLEIKRYSNNEVEKPYIINKYSDVDIYISDINIIKNDINYSNLETIQGLNIYNPQKKYHNSVVSKAIVLKTGNTYNQKDIDKTKQNIIRTNNFKIQQFNIIKENNNLLKTEIFLIPLPKYEFKIGTDIHYSQILNFGFSPKIELTTRNIFGGAENLGTSFSGTVGTTNNAKNPNKLFNAYELSLQISLNMPKLLIPFYDKIIPKKYSPSSSLVLGASVQNNIGLGKINFNTGINYEILVKEKLIHRFTILNTQLNFTQNKSNYYNMFPIDNNYRIHMFDEYFSYNMQIKEEFNHGKISIDGVSRSIITDRNFQNYITNKDNLLFNNFQQSLLNKERHTQDLLINSVIYNLTYNTIGNKKYAHPVYFNLKFELSGNLLSTINNRFETFKTGISGNNIEKGIFGIPYAQFAKLDLDFRKHINFSTNGNSLIMRQFIGIGIPYGNSRVMPYVRSYFNGGSGDIRAWLAFGGLGPADIQIDRSVRSYILDNMKLTTNIEYRFPISRTISGALFVDAGNIWSFKDTGIGDEFKFNKFYKQLGIGSGYGIRFNFSYIIFRLDMAYKIHDPNKPKEFRWNLKNINILQPTFNAAFGYPF